MIPAFLRSLFTRSRAPAATAPSPQPMQFRVAPHDQNARHYVIEHSDGCGWQRLTRAYVPEYLHNSPHLYNRDHPYLFERLEDAVAEAKSWTAERVVRHNAEQDALFARKVAEAEARIAERRKTVYV